MAEYYLTTEVKPAIRREVLKKLSLTGSLLVICSFCYSYFFLKSDLLTAIGSCGVLAGLVVYSYFRSVKQQQALAANYRLVVTPTTITRTQSPLPPIALIYNEITSITQSHAGVLTIATADKQRAVYIPVYISDRAELLRELAAFAPLTISTQQPLSEKLTPLASIAMIGLMGIFYTVSNKVVSTISGVLILGVLAWAGWLIWRNPNLPPQVRRARWFLPLVFLSILAGIIARLQH